MCPLYHHVWSFHSVEDAAAIFDLTGTQKEHFLSIVSGAELRAGAGEKAGEKTGEKAGAGAVAVAVPAAAGAEAEAEYLDTTDILV